MSEQKDRVVEKRVEDLICEKIHDAMITSRPHGGFIQSSIARMVGETPTETTHLAGAPVMIKGQALADQICVEIREGVSMANENARMRAELIEANKAALAAAADTAMARQVLRMAVDQHDREVKALKRVIAGLFSTITMQAQDMERLAAAAVAREYAAPASDKAPERDDDDDWFMPGGLPRGVR